MAVVKDIPEIVDAINVSTPSRSVKRRRDQRSSSYLMCQMNEEMIDGLLIKSGVGSKVQRFQLDTTSPSDNAIDGLSRSLSACVVVIPKHAYLTRVVELPVVQTDDLIEMIRLEAEAQLPPRYGAVEASYRELEVGRGSPTTKRYEIYLVKASIVERCVDVLRRFGVVPTHILPSAVFWGAALDRKDGPCKSDDLLVAPVGCNQYETAHYGQHGEVLVRSLVAQPEIKLRRGLVESVRAMTSGRGSIDSSIRIGYFVARPPAIHSNGQVCMVDRTIEWPPHVEDEQFNGLVSPLLDLAARTWGETSSSVLWRTANLVPRSMVQEAERCRLYRQLIIGSGGFVVAILLVLVALNISTWRYQAEIARLDVSIGRIQADGEAIGDRLTQIEAVAEARDTRNDYANVVGGLHDASSAEGQLSYNQVDLRDDGTLSFRGQATSLALPFELPQQLEALPIFVDVQLRDAGQTNKGVVSITEFRVEAMHRRGAHDESD